MSVPIDKLTLNAPESVYGQQPEDPNLALVRAMTELQARQGAMQRAQMVGKAIATELPQDVGTGRYGLGAALGQIAAAYLTGRQMKKLEAPIAQATSDYALMRQKAADSALRSSNPAAALFGSVDPSLQKLGAAMLERGPPQDAISPKDLLPYVDPKAIPSLVQSGTAGFQPKPREMKEVGGMLYDPESLTVAKLQGAEPTRINVGGDLYEQNPSTGQWKKLDNAPKVNVRVNNQTQMGPGGYQQAYEIARGQAQGGVDAKRMEAAIEGLASANANLQQLTQLEEASKQPYFSGAFADQRLAAEKMAQSLGLPVDAKRIANTEQLATLSAQNVLEKAKNMKGALSDKDVEFLSRSTPGQLSSPEGLRAIIRASRKVTLAEAKKHQETLEALSGESRQMNLPAGNFSAGSPNLPGSDVPISLDEYLNRGR